MTTSPGTEDAAMLAAAVLKRIETENIRNVRLILTDLYGVARGKVVTAARMERAVTEGHPFAIPLFASNLWQRHAPGEHLYSNDIGYRNGVLRLDPLTFAPLPWTPATAHIVTDLYDDAGQIVATPRAVLRRVLDDARSLGLEPVLGSELEFYVYRPDPDGTGLDGTGYEPVYGPQSWFSLHAMDVAQEFVDGLDHAASQMGLPLYEIFSEHGAGQFEVNLEPGSGLLAIDRVVALKIAIKEVARSLGLRATFMARPTSADVTPPSGYHLHQVLLDASGENLFADETGGRRPVGHRAPLRRRATGARRRHDRDREPDGHRVQALPAGHLGADPDRLGGGEPDRPRARPAGGPNTRVENRMGSSDANPYLLAAVMIAAGLDGIRRELDPGDPAQENLFENIRFPRLPSRPDQGVDALLADAELVAALGADFTRTFADVLRFDWERFLRHVTDWEINEYREML